MIALALILMQEPSLPPILPPGINRTASEAFLAAEDALAAGKAKELATQKMLKSLPSNRVGLYFDPQGLTADQVESFKGAASRAFQNWRENWSELQCEWVSREEADIWLSFAKDLGDNGSGLGLGASFQGSANPADARVDATIALVRGKPQIPILPSEVHNETSFAIATYFGLERTVRAGYANFRTDLPGLPAIRVHPANVLFAKRVVACADYLRDLASKGLKVTPARPHLTAEMTSVTLPDAVQGDDVQFTYQVTNNGNSALTLNAEVDCGCLIPAPPMSIEPGATLSFPIRVNTFDFVGKVRKSFWLMSNDPEIPVRKVDVAIDVRPLVRLMPADGKTVLLMDESGADGKLLLLVDPGSKIQPLEAFVDGPKGAATLKPWEGEIGDPSIGLDKQLRKGYEVSIHIEPTMLFGRVPLTIRIRTDAEEPRLKILRSNLEVQRGIVANPVELFFGEIPNVPTGGHVFISRPGKPFKILKVTSSNSTLRGEAQPFGEHGDYRLDIHYDGKFDKGFLEGLITLETDDPKQPQVVVPVRGTLR